MSNYLLRKLAEEAGEIVVAAIKHHHHDTPGTRRQLAEEIGDLYAIVDLLVEARGLSPKAILDRCHERAARERKRAKGK